MSAAPDGQPAGPTSVPPPPTPATVIPSDPGDALARMLELSEQIICEVQRNTHESLSLSPHELTAEWNSDIARYDLEQWRNQRWANLRCELGWNTGGAERAQRIEEQIAKLLVETDGIVPDKTPVWNRQFLARWHAGQAAALRMLDALRECSSVAVGVVRAFPYRLKAVEDDSIWLANSCGGLCRFCPIECSSPRKRTAADWEAEATESQNRQLPLLISYVRLPSLPLRTTLNAYRAITGGSQALPAAALNAQAHRQPVPKDTRGGDSAAGMTDGIHMPDRLVYKGKPTVVVMSAVPLLNHMLQNPPLLKGTGYEEKALLKDFYDNTAASLKNHCHHANQALAAVSHPDRLSRVRISGKGYYIRWVSAEELKGTTRGKSKKPRNPAKKP